MDGTHRIPKTKAEAQRGEAGQPGEDLQSSDTITPDTEETALA